MLRPFRKAVEVLDRRARTTAAAITFLGVAERVALVGATLELVRGSRTTGLVTVVATGALFALRGALRGALRTRVAAALHRASARALLEGDVLAARPLDGEDPQTVLFEGLHHGESLLAQRLPDFAADALASVLLGIFLVSTEPARVLGVAAVAFALASLGVVVARRVTARAQDAAWSAYLPVVDRMLRAIRGRLDLVAHGRDEALRAELERDLAAWSRVSLRSDRLGAFAGRAPIVAGAVGVALALVVDGSFRGALGSTALGEAALFASVLPSFVGLCRGAHELQRSLRAFRPMAGLLSIAKVALTGSGGAPVPDLPATIAWNNVTFAYALPGSPHPAPAIDRVSFSWEPGRLLVITGPNGSGKSTILRLMAGLGAPTSGTITVGGGDLFSADMGAWRRSIAYLPQTPYLPEDASVADAVRLLAPNADDDTIMRALRQVELSDVLSEKAPVAPLSVKVATLSAGQRQRVALARVLVLGKKILLLDEPDNNLDKAGIAMLSALLRDLAQTRMVAVVAHTIDIANVADTIVPLAVAA